jgi:hypothetical protein
MRNRLQTAWIIGVLLLAGCSPGGDSVTVEATVMVSADKEAWRWFAMLCLGFMLFEWWFYHRRTA